MRVVGGSARGRRLRAPAGGGVRPTSDRVREAAFDMLGSLGGVEGATVADLFAGTGAMGIEALSRGASRVTFVEQSPRALSVLRSNLATIGTDDRVDVVRADVLAWLERRARRAGREAAASSSAAASPEATPSAAAAASFDFALCDPPYTFSSWERLLRSLGARVALLEAREPVEAAPGWDVLKVKHYGGTVVTLMWRLPPDPEQGRR